MEQALRIRLELSQNELETIITKALQILQQVEQGGADLAETIRIKQELSMITSKFKEETLYYIEKVPQVSVELVTRWMKLELKANKTTMDISHLLTEHEVTARKQIESSQGERPSTSNIAKLPKLQLPTFDGEILKWHDFWDQFEASVDTATTNNALKMAYLVASLKGSALEAIEGLGTTNQNYSIAVETLKARYGNKRYLIDAHYNALHQLSCAKESPSDCRRVLNTVEKNMRVLQSLGEDTNGNGFRTILLNKFPERVMFQLNIAIKNDSTILAIREQLDNIITAMELSHTKTDVVPDNNPTCSTEALHVRTQLKRSNKGNWHKNFVKPGPSLNDRRPMKRYIAMDTGNTNKRVRRSCIFCDGDHYNDQCETITSLEDRMKKISNRCFKCLKEGHMSKECEKDITCYHCSGSHNRALCRKKITDGNGKGPE